MKFRSIGLPLSLIIAACSNDAASPSYSKNPNTAVPTVAIAASVVPAGCMKFRSTGYSMFVDGAWSGSMHTLIGNEVVAPAPGSLGGGDLTERAFERILKNLPYRGEEWAQFNYADGLIYGENTYTGQPGTVEGQWNYHAQGKFTGGTGRYEGATGAFETQGPFLMYPALDDPEGGVALLTYIGHICLK